MKPGTVVVAYPSGGYVHARFCRALVNAVAWSVDKIAGQIMVEAGPRIASTRNAIVTEFLRSEGEWLLMVDTDMVFGHTFIDEMLEAADAETMPILGALCFGVKDGNRLYPTLYQLPRDGWSQDRPLLNKPSLMHTALTGEPVEVDATGAACLLVHRRVFETMGAKYPKPYRWFAESVLGEWEVGEDITFCLRAKDSGFPIYVHTGIDVGHIKTQVLTRELYEAAMPLPDGRAEVVQLPHPDWPNNEPELGIEVQSHG